MSSVPSSANLSQLLLTLQADSARHAQATAAVTNTLQQISGLLAALLGGNTTAAPFPIAKRRGRPPKALAAPVLRRKRQKFGTTGEESVLGFIQKHGNPSTSEVQAQWLSEGRKASADNAISTLFKKKMIRREKNKQGRGSRYTAV